MKELITDPESFFERIAQFGRVGRSMAVLGVIGAAYSLQALVLVPLLGDRLNAYAGGVSGELFLTFFQPFVVWVVFVVAIWPVAKILGGRPSVGRLINTSAWALSPLVATGVFWTIGRYLALADAQVPPPVEYQGFPRESAALVALYLRPASSEVVFLAFRGLGLLFVLASFYLMVYAVQAISELDRTKAAIAVAPPALFYLAVALQLIVFYSPDAPAAI
ncbi:MAG: YIP1 family protein [Halobacteriaceae archaeon]